MRCAGTYFVIATGAAVGLDRARRRDRPHFVLVTTGSDFHPGRHRWPDRKSTRLNSSHANNSYAVFCLKKKNSTDKVSDALEVMRKYKISGVPITERDGRLVGILTNRDLRFETRFDIPISQVMTKENLITVPVGTTLGDAEEILHKHRVEKLLVVDDKYILKGLITVKDIQKKLKYPNAAKDDQGRLRVAAAIGATGDFLE